MYSLVIVWYTLHGYHLDDLARRRSDQPWYPHKDEPAFEDMLAKLRRTLVAARITGVAAAQPDPANTATTNWPAPLRPHNCETQVNHEPTEKICELLRKAKGVITPSVGIGLVDAEFTEPGLRRQLRDVLGML